MVYESDGQPVYVLSHPIQQPNYAYTRQHLVSPIRHHVHGQSNIPMTYSGPPCVAEIQRNHKRRGNGHVD
jgi:hypothetical protein